MSQFAVMGYPIDHSLSPVIHRAFGETVGRVVTYERQEVEAGALAKALLAFRVQGGLGVNVTVPLKAEAAALAGRLSPRAQRARAVNTLSWAEDVLVGDNTDGVGLIRDLRENHGLALSGSRVLLVGAGGAAFGIAGPLLDEGVAQLAIVNRTPERAQDLAASLGDDRILILSAADCDTPFDYVINATAAGLSGSLPALPGAVFRQAVAYDLMYGPRAEGFLSHARGCGARLAFDGLGMLVEQAAESFFLWHGVRPPTGPVLHRLRMPGVR